MALSTEQIRNAQIIMQVGLRLGASRRDILIALMAAMQESSLRNLSGGDRDSVGLFQQRAGWGSYAQRHDPATAARMFFSGGMYAGTPGLLEIRQRGSMGLTYAAQKVQRSAYPTAYAKHEGTARSLMGNMGAPIATSGGFIRPVRGGSITSGFGPRRGGHGISSNHHGLDIGIPVGTPVYAAASGRVVRVTNGGNYGNRIEISHEGKLYTLYAHLSGVSVRRGQQVIAGQAIGRSGGRRGAPGAGNSTGPHLHFEVRVGANAYGNARDPQAYLNGSTTPGAYIDNGFTTEMAELDPEQLQDPMATATAKPYVYVNPIDALSGSFMDLASEDPMEGLRGSRLAPSLGESIEPEQLPQADLVGV